MLSHRERRNHRDAQRDVRRNAPLEKRGNRVVKGFIPGQQGDDDGRVQPEDGPEDPEPVQQQEHAYKGGEGVIANPFLAVLMHGLVRRSLLAEPGGMAIGLSRLKIVQP